MDAPAGVPVRRGGKTKHAAAGATSDEDRNCYTIATILCAHAASEAILNEWAKEHAPHRLMRISLGDSRICYGPRKSCVREAAELGIEVAHGNTERQRLDRAHLRLKLRTLDRGRRRILGDLHGGADVPADGEVVSSPRTAGPSTASPAAHASHRGVPRKPCSVASRARNPYLHTKLFLQWLLRRDRVSHLDRDSPAVGDYHTRVGQRRGRDFLQRDHSGNGRRCAVRLDGQ